MPKSSQKYIYKIIGVSFWPPSSPDHNPLDYAIWGVLENKTNATSHPNIGSLMTSQILTIRRILEGVQAKNLQVTLLFVDFTKAFDSIHRGKMEQILLAYSLPKESVAAIMILCRNTKMKVCSPNRDTE